MAESISNNGNTAAYPLVSVIMNCFNSAEFLREAVESVLAQTYTSWEIIFWDNQSTDESAEIYKNYTDQRLKYFYAPEHTVLGQARNLAVAQAKGEWLGFLDCDDVWLPEKLEKQVSIINREGPETGLVYGQMLVIINGKCQSLWSRRMAKYQTKTRLAILPEGSIFSKLVYDNFIPLVTALVSSVAYAHSGGITPTYKHSEDFDLFLKITGQFKARAVQEVIALYRIHDKNVSESQHNELVSETFDILKRYLPSKVVQNSLKLYYAKEAVYRIRLKDFNGLNKIVKESGGMLKLLIPLLKTVIIYFKNRYVRI